MRRSRQPRSRHPDWPGPQRGHPQPRQSLLSQPAGKRFPQALEAGASLPPRPLPPSGLWVSTRWPGCTAVLGQFTATREGFGSRWGRVSCPPPRRLGGGQRGLGLSLQGSGSVNNSMHTCAIYGTHAHTTCIQHTTHTHTTNTHTQEAFALASDGISPIAPGLTRGQQRASLPAHLEAQRTLRSSVHHQPQERAAPWPSCGPKPQVREYTLPGTSNLKSSRCPGNPWGLTLLALSNISHLDHSISTICPLGAISPPLATLSPYHTQPLASEAGSELGIQRPWASRPL